MHQAVHENVSPVLVLVDVPLEKCQIKHFGILIYPSAAVRNLKTSRGESQVYLQQVYEVWSASQPQKEAKEGPLEEDGDHESRGKKRAQKIRH